MTAATTFTAHDRYAHPLGVSPDGRWLATGGWDGGLAVWECDDWRELARVDGHEQSVNAGAVTLTGTILSGSTDGTVRAWESSSLDASRVVGTHSNTVAGLAVHPDDTLAASASYDSTVGVHDIDGTRPSRRLTGHPKNVTTVAFVPEADAVVAGGLGPHLFVWELDGAMEPVTELGSHGAAVVGVSVDADGRPWSLGYDGTLSVWDSSTWSLDDSYTPDLDATPTGLAFEPTGSRLAVTHDHGVTILDQTGQIVDSHETDVKGIYTPCWSPSGDWLVVGGADGRIRRYEH